MKRFAQRMLDRAFNQLAARDGWSVVALLLVLAVPVVAVFSWLLD